MLTCDIGGERKLAGAGAVAGDIDQVRAAVGSPGDRRLEVARVVHAGHTALHVTAIGEDSQLRVVIGTPAGGDDGLRSFGGCDGVPHTRVEAGDTGGGEERIRGGAHSSAGHNTACGGDLDGTAANIVPGYRDYMQ